MRHLIRNVRFYIGEIFQNFSYPETYVYEKEYTLTNTQIYTLKHTPILHIERDTIVMTVGKIYNVDLPKKA